MNAQQRRWLYQLLRDRHPDDDMPTINCRCVTMPVVANPVRDRRDPLLVDIAAEWRAQAIVAGHAVDAGPR